MSGHVFISRGDLTALACDAWLLPTDVALRVTDTWQRACPAKPPTPPGWDNAGIRVTRSGRPPLHQPEPWFVNVGGLPGQPTRWFMEGVRQFIDEAAAAMDGTDPANGRERPLLGVPLVGTGAGGAASVAGDVVRALLSELHDGVERHTIDVALVLHDPEPFAAAQAARRELGLNSWPGLPPPLREVADELASHARLGELVLFIGAGASAGAGLPLWSALLKDLAREAGVDESRIRQMERMPAVDKALIVEREIGGPDRLGAEIVKRLTASRCSLVHQLLASLGIRESATTNYDTLYELACAGAGHEIAVLPYEAAPSRDGWLLKMHGSVDHPGDIVLTRSDYLEYSGRRAALMGIVQALLITRRMLFVGFSLSDDNFHRIAHDVRRAIGTQPRGPFATALLLNEEPLLQELWSGDVHVVGMDEADADAATSARRLEIFLDYLVHRASTATAHLLDPAYAGALSADERALARHLTTFVRSVPAEARRAPAWELISRTLQAMGQPAGRRRR